MKFLTKLLVLLFLTSSAFGQNTGGGPNGGGGGGGTAANPGGSATQIQYNVSGTSFGGVAGFTWNGTQLTTPYNLDSNGDMAASAATSANHVTVGYAAQANIGYLTGLQATNQSYEAFAGRNTNAGGYTVISLMNDSYSLGSLLSVPNSAACCDVNAFHQFNIYFGGSAAPAGFLNSQPAGESAAIATTGAFPICIGTFGHCETLWDGPTGSIFQRPSTGGAIPALDVVSVNTSAGTTTASAIRATAQNSTDASYGIDIIAGTSVNDWALRVNGVNGPSASQTFLTISGNGVIKSLSPNRLQYPNYNMQTGSGGGLSMSLTGFVGTTLGNSGSVNVSGPIICVRMNPATGTSNSTAMTVDLTAYALPGSGEGMVLVTDNGTVKQGTWYYNGTIMAFSVGTVPATAGGNFTSTGTKGLPGTSGPVMCWGAN